MKKWPLVFAAILIILFIGLSTYYWFWLFIDIGTDGTLKRKSVSETVSLVDENPVYDVYDKEQIFNTFEPYYFRITNTGTTKKINVVLNDVDPSSINDGCNLETTLKREELTYVLKRENKEIKSGKLSDLKDNILYTDTILVDVTLHYSLEVNVDDYADPKEGYHYHYKLSLEVLG